MRRTTRVVRSSELRARRGKVRTSRRGEIDDIRADNTAQESYLQRLRPMTQYRDTLTSLGEQGTAVLSIADIESILLDLVAQPWSLGDDEAVSFPLPSDTFTMVMIWGETQDVPADPAGLFLLRGSSDPGAYVIGGSGGADVDLTTGDLTGTTGADGHFTISAADGQLGWLENRSGANRSGKYIIFGRTS